MAIASTKGKASDIVEVKIGNLPPHQTVKMVFSYASELLTSLNKFWKLLIPSTLTPRYQSPTSIYKNLTNALETLKETGKYQDYFHQLEENLNDMNLNSVSADEN